jgi:diguanylate cyclase (GGDEF)-like protein
MVRDYIDHRTARAMSINVKTQNATATRWPRTSIRTRIMILALLLIVPLMIDRVRLLENTRSERIAHTVTQVAGLAERGAEAQSGAIRSTRALLQVVARAYIALAPGGQGCAALLSGFASDVPWVRGLSVVGADDRIACSTRATSVGIDLSDRDYIVQARRTRDFVQSDYLIEHTAEPTLVTAYPALGKDERADVVVLAAVELQWVNRFAQQIGARLGATAFLLDSRGHVLSALPGRIDDIAPSTPERPLLRGGAGERMGSFTATGVDGVRRIYAFRKLVGSDVSIVVGIDEGEALGRVDRDIAFAYMQLAVFGLAAVMLAWFCGERFIIAPIRALAHTAAGIGRGEHAQRLVPARWTVEFAPLATALNDMARKLAERESELRTANRHLEELALVDALSGLPNRRAFDMRLTAAWQAADSKTPISLLMIDVDHFKLFNDTYGHLDGDNCLRLIGKSLESVVRPSDLAARFGGEEFVMLLPGIDSAGAAAVAECSRAVVEALRIGHQAAPSGQVSISIGVAILVIGEAASEQALLEAADQALYDAKRRGRNAVATWTPVMLAKAS